MLQTSGNLLVVQWLSLCASNAGGADSIPGQGTNKCCRYLRKLSSSYSKNMVLDLPLDSIISHMYFFIKHFSILVDYISVYLVDFVLSNKKPNSKNGLMEFFQLQK